jgi:hypothetical protein
MTPDWRDTVRVASDVAVLGLLMVATSLPVLTTGAAFATASFAVHQFLTHDRWPSLRATWQVFRRTLLPGALATAAVAAAAWLVTVDLAALARGAAPGGSVLLGLTAVIIAAAAGYAALALVALGTHLATTTADTRAPWHGAAPTYDAGAGAAVDGPATSHGNASGSGRGTGRGARPGAWRAAARAAVAARPATVAAASGVVGLAGLLALLVHPILAGCLVGYALYALHVVTRRLTPNPASPAASLTRD